jgi:ADP-heptose:LPS heptosyltransferase
MSENQKKTKKVLVLHTLMLGDYFLLRELIRQIKTVPGYENCNLTLMASPAEISAARFLDADVIDRFIASRWFIRQGKPNLPEGILSAVQNACSWIKELFRYCQLSFTQSFDVVVNTGPSGTRNLMRSTLFLKAKKVAIEGFIPEVLVENRLTTCIEKKMLWGLKRLGLFEKIITIPYTPCQFRGRVFQYLFETAFQHAAFSQGYQLTVLHQPANAYRLPYLLIFPFASTPLKDWPLQHYMRLANWLLSWYPGRLVFCGTYPGSTLPEDYVTLINQHAGKATDLINQTTLPAVLQLVADAQLVISNDSFAYHAAVLQNTPSVIFSDGRYLGEYYPYPKLRVQHTMLFPDGFNLTPEQVKQQLNTYPFTLKDISVEQAKSAIVHYLPTG